MEEMKAKIEVKVYKCEYCGKPHTTIPERTKCELNCEAEEKKKEAFEKARMLRETKQRRYDEIENLIAEFNKDYKTNLSITNNYQVKVNLNGKDFSKEFANVCDRLIRCR